MSTSNADGSAGEASVANVREEEALMMMLTVFPVRCRVFRLEAVQVTFLDIHIG